MKNGLDKHKTGRRRLGNVTGHHLEIPCIWGEDIYTGALYLCTCSKIETYQIATKTPENEVTNCTQCK